MRALRFLLREIVLALGLLVLGLVALPAMVYFVGQMIIGPYDAGLAGLYEAIADELIAGRAFAWLMILSPYLSIQIVRLWLRVRRPQRDVT